MTENMKNFLQKVSEDKALAEKIGQLDKEALITVEKELDFELTEAGFVQLEGDLSEDELETVAGGGICSCILRGGGTRKNGNDPCGCVLFGVGTEQYTVSIAIGVEGPKVRNVDFCPCSPSPNAKGEMQQHD